MMSNLYERKYAIGSGYPSYRPTWEESAHAAQDAAAFDGPASGCSVGHGADSEGMGGHGASDDDRLGRVVGGCRLLSVLGTGSSSIVYVAQREDHPQTLVAVKILAYRDDMGPAERASVRGRFLREARSVCKLRHENILPVLSYGDADDLTYMVLPLVAGGTLAAWLADRSRPIPLALVADIANKLASALDYAHWHGVVHRDVKPANILIGPHNQVNLADFGIARLFEGGEDALTREDWATLTRTGHVIGTPQYMAPEQIAGGPVGPATDIYSLGVVLYLLVTGHVPFDGTTPLALAMQHLHELPTPPRALRPELPAAAEAAILRALDKHPARRFATAGALAEAFAASLETNASSPRNAEASIMRSNIPSTTRLADYVLEAPLDCPDQIAHRPGERSHLTEQQVALQPPRPSPQDASYTVRRLQAPASTASLSAGESAGRVESSAQRSAPPPILPPAPADRVGRKRGMSLFRRRGRFALLAAVLFLGITGTALAAHRPVDPRALAGNAALATGTQASGEVVFLDNPRDPSPGGTDALSIVVTGLSAPPAGSHYAAWLTDMQNEHDIALGTLAAGIHGAYTLRYEGSVGSQGGSGNNLLGQGQQEMVWITLEHDVLQAPVGRVVLGGMLPRMAFMHVQHLLVAYDDTPNHIGLLVGLLDQSRKLAAQALILESIAASGDTQAIQCVAQTVVDIIEGSHGPNYQPISITCDAEVRAVTGDGYGILGDGYLTDAADHASRAAHQPDTTDHIRLVVSRVEAALANIKAWVTTADQDALSLLANPSDTGKVHELATLCVRAFVGTDQDGDGQVDPVAGEGGAVTAYAQGQALATLPLSPKPAGAGGMPGM